MNPSWNDFLEAVERMRESQKVYFRTKTAAALTAARRSEKAVDDAIKARRAEWAREIQPELIGDNHG